jgi:hypothetical protein
MLRRRRIGGCFAAMVARFVRHLWMEALPSLSLAVGVGSHGVQALYPQVQWFLVVLGSRS